MPNMFRMTVPAFFLFCFSELYGYRVLKGLLVSFIWILVEWKEDLEHGRVFFVFSIEFSCFDVIFV